MKHFLKAYGQYPFFAERDFFLIAGPSRDGLRWKREAFSYTWLRWKRGDGRWKRLAIPG